MQQHHPVASHIEGEVSPVTAWRRFFCRAKYGSHARMRHIRFHLDGRTGNGFPSRIHHLDGDSSRANADRLRGDLRVHKNLRFPSGGSTAGRNGHQDHAKKRQENSTQLRNRRQTAPRATPGHLQKHVRRQSSIARSIMHGQPPPPARHPSYAKSRCRLRDQSLPPEEVGGNTWR
jgi:hypothetical protein